MVYMHNWSVSTLMYLHLSIYTYVSTLMYLHLCIYTYVSTLMYLHLCIYTYVSTLMYLHLCIYTYVSTLMYLHLCSIKTYRIYHTHGVTRTRIAIKKIKPPYLDDLFPLESLNLTGTSLSVTVAMPQLAVVSVTPTEYLATLGQSNAVAI